MPSNWSNYSAAALNQSDENNSSLFTDSPLFPPILPLELREMTSASKSLLICHFILFIIATPANLTVLVTVHRQYKLTRSRISLLILHLSIADLFVCCTVIPIEIFWRMTIQWTGGTMLCKVCQFLRAFGLYLSSNVLICLSIDRFLAIWFPLKMLNGQGLSQVKVMLTLAWIFSLVFSSPQALLFSVASHPEFPSFKQCVTNELLGTSGLGPKIYSIFSVSVFYFAPLVVIIVTYSLITVKLMRKVRRERGLGSIIEGKVVTHSRVRLMKRRESPPGHHDISSEGETDKQDNKLSPLRDLVPNHHIVLRRNSNALTRAMNRSLVTSVVIVIVFVLCWTPYVVMTMWYMLDWEGAARVDPALQDVLFVMAVANSCVNPIVYGSFAKHCCCYGNRSRPPT